MKSIWLAILNYHGKKHLDYLLPTVCAAAQKFSGTCAVLVLDNQSTGDDVTWIQRKFPSVQTIVAPKNDFLFSYNWLAQKRSEDVLVFLNNDLKVNPDFIAPLVRHFESPDVFSVSARSYDWNAREVTSGPACLKSLLEGHGIAASYARLREACHTDVDGTSIDTLEQVACDLGLDGQESRAPSGIVARVELLDGDVHRAGYSIRSADAPAVALARDRDVGRADDGAALKDAK